MAKKNPAYKELDQKILILAARGVHVSDKQIAEVAGTTRIVIKNRRKALKLKRLTLVLGKKEVYRRYAIGHPDKARKHNARSRDLYKIRVLTHYGLQCKHPDAPVNCSRQLHIHHVHQDGKIHRLALGKYASCSMLTMYKFIWKVITLGPQTDRFGRVWNERDFEILCRSHNQRLQ